MCKRGLGRRFFAAAAALVLLLMPAAAVADSLDVSADVQAPLPTTLPVITDPGSNTAINTPTVEVIGSCPVVVPSLIVILIRNGETIGTGICNSSGQFHIRITLVLGVNTIWPKFMTVTGQSGGFGLPLVLTYSGSGETSTTAPTPATNTPAFSMGFLYDLVVYTTHQKLTLQIVLTGGTAPYNVFVNWGDGLSRHYTFNSAGTQTIEHTYGSVDTELGRILIKANDANGTEVIQERAIFSFEKPAAAETSEQKTTRLTYAVWIGAVVVSLLLVALQYKQLTNGASKRGAGALPLVNRPRAGTKSKVRTRRRP